ncbi:hypothetical protein AAFN88_01475 [Pelagibius sp. CAU 1746]|uniref:hypothetical protein n=1 Tax=Pelagibius sp. CAU 1746 TaxID=3140370 RepID=UPI00325ABAF2
MRRAVALPLFAATFLVLLASFHLFSRITVDDAFITWRYGKNLVEHGVWGYNPTAFDLTQAYTNPIYALASILPAALGMDVVLFFKLVSLALLAGFVAIFCRLSRDKTLGLFLALLFAALPATIVHGFAGLETFLYVAALGFLFIAVAKGDLRAATLLSALLVLTRPEAWLLVGLVPAQFFLMALLDAWGRGEGLRAVFRWRRLWPVVSAQAFLLLFFGAYAAFHYAHFGDVLPNTFYVKSAAAFNLYTFVSLSILLLPLLGLVPAGQGRVAFFAVLLFAPIIYTYSTSPLQMNYVARFSYHLFAPIYILCAWLAASPGPAVPKRKIGGPAPAENRSGAAWPMTAISIASLAVFALISTRPAHLTQMMNNYPHALQANAVLGRSLAELHAAGAVRSFSLGDAGIVAFQSGMVALDNIGLGSALVARNGVTETVVDSYAPDVIVFHSRPGRIRLAYYGQEVLFRWAERHNYRFLCEIFLNPNYTLRVYTGLELKGLARACTLSQRANNLPQAEFLKTHFFRPPWRFWRE